MTRPRNLRLTALAALALVTTALTGCGAQSASDDAAAERNSTYTTEATDAFPVTVEHQFGSTTVDAEPQRIVVVGLTEQDILLELGMPPVATTEWYGEQEYATWPWATDLLNGAEPVVLSTADGFEYEEIASLDPDLIVGTNAGLTQDTYDKLSEIAPTITSVDGSAAYFSDWKSQTRQVAAAVGRTAAGEELIENVESTYADAAAAHPEFAGLTATFSQGAPWEGNLYVYPDGVNTDFLTDLGFTITPGLEEYAAEDSAQALISAENIGLIEADVVVFATDVDDDETVPTLLSFGTLADLPAVAENRAVYTDATLAGAVYFMTPLSQRYVVERLVPLLAEAVQGEAPQTQQG